MAMYPTLCKVRLAYEFNDKTHREEKVVLLQAENYTDAMKQIEEYYGDDLEGVDIIQFAETMLEFPIEDYDHIHSVMNDYI